MRRRPTGPRTTAPPRHGAAGDGRPRPGRGGLRRTQRARTRPAARHGPPVRALTSRALSALPARRAALLGAAVVAALVLLGTVPAAVAPDHPRAAGTAVPPAPDEDAVPPIETAAALGPRERARISALLDDRFSGGPGRVAVSVQDLRTGAAFGYAADAEFRVASVVKLDMVVHMLLDAQREDRFLTDREQALAERMLCHSDNDAADTAFRRNGFTSGFADATARLGLADTSPHENGAWGMSSTTAADRLRLLRAVFTDASPLDERSRAYLRSLMGAVAPEQAWGISAAAGPGTAELKNGWAPAPGGGPWNVHSTGSVERDGRRYLAAVLTDGAPDYGTGVATVEDAAGLVIEELGTALDRHP